MCLNVITLHVLEVRSSTRCSICDEMHFARAPPLSDGMVAVPGASKVLCCPLLPRSRRTRVVYLSCEQRGWSTDRHVRIQCTDRHVTGISCTDRHITGMSCTNRHVRKFNAQVDAAAPDFARVREQWHQGQAGGSSALILGEPWNWEHLDASTCTLTARRSCRTHILCCPPKVVLWFHSRTAA